RLPALDVGEDSCQLVGRRQAGVADHWRGVCQRGVSDPIDHRLEQGLLRIEVVVEGAPRGAELLEQVLDAHRLVALGLQQALGGLHEGLLADSVLLEIQGPGHRRDNSRPTVGLLIQICSPAGCRCIIPPPRWPEVPCFRTPLRPLSEISTAPPVLAGCQAATSSTSWCRSTSRLRAPCSILAAAAPEASSASGVSPAWPSASTPTSGLSSPAGRECP